MDSIYNFLKNVWIDLKNETKEDPSFIFILFLLITIPLSLAISNVFLILFILTTLIKWNKKNFYFSKVNNLCILTGRQSGVYKVCKISRIELRNSKHDIYGFRKSS